MLIVSLTLGLLLAAGVATVGVLGPSQRGGDGSSDARRTGPLALPPVHAPKANSRACDSLLAELPGRLSIDDDPVPRRELAAPAPPATVAWGDAQHDPISLRCGINAPAELKPTSKLIEISGVRWLPLRQGRTTTWLAVDRPVYVALTVSGSAGSGPVQDVSAVLDRTLPEQDVFS